MERLEPDCARQILGFRKFHTSYNTAEKGHLMDVAKMWKEEICTGKSDRRDMWSNLNLRLRITLEYPLLVTPSSYDEC